ncbi:MAG: RsmE family RNA methyltransferase [Chitinophagales bacterium]
MQLFYQANIEDTNIVYELDSQESFHAFKVLRKTVGDVIFVTNGKGDMFQAEIVSISKKKCSIKIIECKSNNTKPSKLTIALAPTKNISRIEWFVEKAVEIGINEIKFFTSQNSERRILKEERLQLKALSAMKQSLKAYLPKVSTLQKLEYLLKNESQNYETKLIAYCKEDSIQLVNNVENTKNTIILIGPEGGFSEKEVALAEHFGFKSVSLGSSRLRTETAAIFTTSVFNALN